MKDEFGYSNRKQDSAYRLPEDYWPRRHESLKAIAADPARNRRSSPPWWWLASGTAAALLIGFFAFQYNLSAADLSRVSESTLENYLLSEFNYPANEELIESESQDLDLSNEQEIDNDKLDQYLNDNFDESLHYEYL